MISDLTIRQVQGFDAKALGVFLEDNARPEITRHFHPFALTAATADQICGANQVDRYFIAVRQHHIVGLAMLRGWSQGFSTPSFGLLVDYRETGNGIGR